MRTFHRATVTSRFQLNNHRSRRYTQSLCNFLTKLIATGDDKKGLYLHVIVRKIPCAPAPCLQLLETTFRFIADEILLAVGNITCS